VLRAVSVTPIGEGYGFSGRSYRVTAETTQGGTQTFVVKQEHAAGVERELLFRRDNESSLRGSIAACYGGTTDGERGMLVLEDVSPAKQGDVLIACSDEEADAVVRVLARVHAVSWRAAAGEFAAELPRWSTRRLQDWDERLARARERFPTIVTSAVSARLRGFPSFAGEASAELAAGPASWIHTDAHLDNVLWRRNGAAVFLDWSGAVIGPPAVDLARCLTEGIDAGVRRDRAVTFVSSYCEELTRAGVAADVEQLSIALADALTLLQEVALAWAGRPENGEPVGRMAAMRANLLRSACAWLTSD
jgi:Phosphotransferase enzyme family